MPRCCGVAVSLLPVVPPSLSWVEPRGAECRGWDGGGALGAECSREDAAVDEELWVPSVHGRTRPWTRSSGDEELWVPSIRGALGAECSREDAAVDGTGGELWVPSVRGRRDDGAVDEEELWVPSVRGRTCPCTRRVGSSGCQAFVGGRGRG